MPSSYNNSLSEVLNHICSRGSVCFRNDIGSGWRLDYSTGRGGWNWSIRHRGSCCHHPDFGKAILYGKGDCRAPWTTQRVLRSSQFGPIQTCCFAGGAHRWAIRSTECRCIQVGLSSASRSRDRRGSGSVGTHRTIFRLVPSVLSEVEDAQVDCKSFGSLFSHLLTSRS